MSDKEVPLDGGTMYAVDAGSEPLRPLGMQAWAVDAQRAQVVFAASHRVETFALAGGRGPDPYLVGLASGGWSRFEDFEGWAEPAADWSAVLDVAGDVLTVTSRDGVCFYEGGLNCPRAWRRTARRHGVFVALAGSITGPRDIAEAQLRGEMYALLCPVVLV
ncbi:MULTISPECIES: hypothetical protein [Streptacidiphilus]|uniref:Uncharacterized protein n=1 Tax=Streptacidiphilus cavernicola TaxID=3342716 RepID=A0ABV6UW37_9ACTN|nr:hypothetical protein [Streptacidiphilus jeojiense]